MIDNNLKKKKIYLNCTYEFAAKVKALGAKWDPNWKMWYIDKSMDRSQYKRWLPKI